jgi:hypothetical protein
VARPLDQQPGLAAARLQILPALQPRTVGPTSGPTSGKLLVQRVVPPLLHLLVALVARPLDQQPGLAAARLCVLPLQQFLPTAHDCWSNQRTYELRTISLKLVHADYSSLVAARTIYFAPISSSKVLSLVAAPRTVHDKEKHSSIATHLLSIFKPIGVSSSQVGRMRRRKGGRLSFEVRFLLR